MGKEGRCVASPLGMSAFSVTAERRPATVVLSVTLALTIYATNRGEATCREILQGKQGAEATQPLQCESPAPGLCQSFPLDQRSTASQEGPPSHKGELRGDQDSRSARPAANTGSAKLKAQKIKQLIRQRKASNCDSSSNFHENSRAEFSSTDSGEGRFLGINSCQGGADGPRQSWGGGQKPYQPPLLPQAGRSSGGRGFRAGLRSRDAPVTVTAGTAGASGQGRHLLPQGHQPWGRHSKCPGRALAQPSFTVHGACK